MLTLTLEQDNNEPPAPICEAPKCLNYGLWWCRSCAVSSCESHISEMIEHCNEENPADNPLEACERRQFTKEPYDG